MSLKTLYEFKFLWAVIILYMYFLICECILQVSTSVINTSNFLRSVFANMLLLREPHHPCFHTSFLQHPLKRISFVILISRHVSCLLSASYSEGSNAMKKSKASSQPGLGEGQGGSRTLCAMLCAGIWGNPVL